MKPGLEVGRSATVRFVVTQEMCPHFDGVLVHPVCATWTIVHQMEVAGRKLLAPFLEDHEEGVGAHISIDHRAPAPVGCEVVTTATATEVTCRRLVARVTAHVRRRLIAEGTFVQSILPKTLLAEHFRRAAEEAGIAENPGAESEKRND